MGHREEVAEPNRKEVDELNREAVVELNRKEVNEPRPPQEPCPEVTKKVAEANRTKEDNDPLHPPPEPTPQQELDGDRKEDGVQWPSQVLEVENHQMCCEEPPPGLTPQQELNGDRKEDDVQWPSQALEVEDHMMYCEEVAELNRKEVDEQNREKVVELNRTEVDEPRMPQELNRTESENYPQNGDRKMMGVENHDGAPRGGDRAEPQGGG